MSPLNEEGSVYEGLQVRTKSAPFSKRLLAYATDIALVTCVIYAAFIVLVIPGILSFAALQSLVKEGALGKGLAAGSILIIIILLLGILSLYHGYFIYFESRKGFTPGKKLFGLQVTSTKGGRLTPSQCILRDMMRYIDCMLILPGLLSILLTKRGQRLGDLMAGTLVIHSQHQEQANNFLYMKQDDYLVLSEAWSPTLVPIDICRQYLEFAYPIFCQGKAPIRFDDVEKWQDICLNFVHPKTTEPIEQQTLLIFFAELCFQTFQKTTKRS